MTIPSPPRVSVLLPIRNGAATLEAAMNSITTQTYDNSEIICVDDASTDATPAMLRRWRQRLGSRVRILTHAEQWGLTRSLNQAISTARGELLARIDADDIWLPDKLRQQIAILERRPEVGIVGCWYENVTAQGNILFRLPETDEAIQRSMFRKNPLGHSCIVMRKSLIEHHGGYDESIRYGQDHELWLRLMPHTAFYNIPATLCRRRAGGISDHFVRQQMLQGVRTRLRYLRRYHASPSEYMFLIEPLLVAAAPAAARRLWRRWRARRSSPHRALNQKQQLRVACINDRFLPSIRAEQVARLNMAAGFTAAGAAVDFWYHSRPRRPRPLPSGSAMRLRPVSAPYLASPAAPARVINRLLFLTNSLRLAVMLPRSYDLLYLRCGALHGLLFAFRSHLDPARLILEIHNLVFGHRPIVDQLYRYIFSRCEKVVCITAATQKNWRAAGIPPHKILLLPSSASRSHDSGLTASQARQRLGLPSRAIAPALAGDGLPDSPLAVYSGNMYDDRNIAEIIAAAADLPHIHVVLVGGTADDAARWQQHIRNQYGRLPSVRFVGYQPAALIPIYLQAADILLVTYSRSCPTVATMSPMKFAEAAAAGKPIVAADLPRIREMAGQHPVAWYTPDDSHSLSQAINTACRLQPGKSVSAVPGWKERAQTIMHQTL